MLRISYPTLCRMLNAGDFVPPVNGRRRKLLFDPDAVEAWVKARSPPVNPTVTNPVKQKQQDKDRKRRIQLARDSLNRHRANVK
jgi:hypothetical protein